MVVAGVVPAATLSLLPSQLSRSSFPFPHSSSRLHQFSTTSSSLLSKTHKCHHFIRNGSLVYLIRDPNSSGLSSLRLHRRLKPIPALDSDVPDPIPVEEIINKDEAFNNWDWWTAKFTATANIPFLLLQLPQILLNARNLMAGNNSALLAVSWLVMWSTFVPHVPNSVLPGAVCFVIALVAVAMARMGKLSDKGIKFVGAISGWTATLLFMWMPVAQMWTNFLNPDNIKGLSSLSMVLALLGNGLLIPRALFVRDFMWFTGSTWATFLYGWGNLLCLFLFNCISPEFFWGVTSGISIWIGLTLWKDSKACGHGSPLRSLKELVFGS